MTTLVRITAGTLADQTSVMAWCEQGREALDNAANLADAKGILSVAATLDHAVRLRDMNEQAVIAASRLRILAERRVGELIAEERQDGRLATRQTSHLRVLGHVSDDDMPSDLAEHGITRNEASAYSKLAAVPADRFEQVLDEVAAEAGERRVGITRAAVLRTINPQAEKRPDERAEDFDQFIDACSRASARSESALTALRWGSVTEGNPWPEATVNHARRVLTALTVEVTNILKELDR